MALTAEQMEQQKKQAEELLFSGPQTLGFAKGLFFGHFNAGLLFPYPEFGAAEQAKVNQAVDEVRRFMTEHVDSTAIDRDGRERTGGPERLAEATAGAAWHTGGAAGTSHV